LKLGLGFSSSSPEKERGKWEGRREQPFLYDTKGVSDLHRHHRCINLGVAILCGVPQ